MKPKRSLLKAILLRGTLLGILGLAGCCCDDIFDNLSKRYDYFKGWYCRSSSTGKGCVKVPTEGHVEIKVEHDACVTEACRYRAKNPAPQTSLGLQIPRGATVVGATACLTFNDEAVTFFTDRETAAELANTFGGNWVAFTQLNPIFPGSGEGGMDSFMLGYRLVFSLPLTASGVPLPSTVNYSVALFDPDAAEWVNSPTAPVIQYDPVIVSITDMRGGQFPWETRRGQNLAIGQVHIKNTGEVRRGLSMEAVVVQGGRDVQREVVIPRFDLTPWQLIGRGPVPIRTAGLEPGVYIVAIEVKDGTNVLGRKEVSIRVVTGGASLSAQLSGDQEAPPVKTRATGAATFILNDAGTAINYQFRVSGLEGITAAHIHVGARGTAGPIILPLSITTMQGVLTAADFMPAGGLQTFNDAVQAMLRDNTYINVHTQRHPGGEIRGQILLQE